MQHNVVRIVVAGVAVCGALGIISAQPLIHWTPEVEILVNGAPQRRYAHDGRWYIEALKGREYAVRVRNPYPVRVGVALSVDGLNTIDARHTDAVSARKWVIGPYQTITISGWQTSRTDARRFEFTSEEQSYGQALGQTADLGVISAVFFKEREAAIARDSRSERAAPAAPSARAGQSAGDVPRALSDAAIESTEEYAATGMGRRTDHAIREVSVDLEDAPAHTVNIRYEYRAQLVRLGILPSPQEADRLKRRERARGFEGGFSPEGGVGSR